MIWVIEDLKSYGELEKKKRGVKMKKRNELELTLLLEKLSNRYPNKVFGISKITFDDLYNNSEVVFDLQEKHNFKNFGDLIKVFDIIVDDFRSYLDNDSSLTFEEYYKLLN